MYAVWSPPEFEDADFCVKVSYIPETSSTVALAKQTGLKQKRERSQI